MEECIKLFELVEEEDDYGISNQEVLDDGSSVFYVYDLTECPEDASIGRDLFDAYDWLKAVEYGIKLASKGYTGVGFRG